MKAMADAELKRQKMMGGNAMSRSIRDVQTVWSNSVLFVSLYKP